jgi:ribosomal-protein-serine acetyltransferase
MMPHVSIRPYEEMNMDEVAAAVRESLPELSQWFPWAHAEYSAKDAVAWARVTQEARATGAAYEFAIVDPDGRHAGGCGVNRIQRLDGVANLGYWLRTSVTGRGFASAAVREVVRWTFANTALHRLEIVAAITNVRSQRVAERVGAHRDAVLRKRTIVNGATSDAVLYSILRPD